ncbi:hypothetical protein LSO9J_50048 [Candidatus Liberibacter solanacearum]
MYRSASRLKMKSHIAESLSSPAGHWVRLCNLSPPKVLIRVVSVFTI